MSWGGGISLARHIHQRQVGIGREETLLGAARSVRGAARALRPVSALISSTADVERRRGDPMPRIWAAIRASSRRGKSHAARTKAPAPARRLKIQMQCSPLG